MRRTTLYKNLSIYSGLLLTAASYIFEQYAWWPNVFKIPWAFPSGAVIGIALFASVWIADKTWSAWKRDTNVILADNARFFFNPNDRTREFGGFLFTPLNGANVPKVWLNIQGNHGTLITPLEAVQPFGKNRIDLCSYRRVPLSEIKKEYRHFVEGEKCPGPYYLGLAPRHVETRGRDWAQRFDAWRRENAVDAIEERSSQRVVLSLRKGIDQQADTIQALTDRTPAGWFKRLGDRMSRRDDEDDDDTPDAM